MTEETHVRWEQEQRAEVTIYDPHLPNGFRMFTVKAVKSERVTPPSLLAEIQAGYFRWTADGRELELTEAGIAHYKPAVEAERRAWFEERGLPDNTAAEPQTMVLV